MIVAGKHFYQSLDDRRRPGRIVLDQSDRDANHGIARAGIKCFDEDRQGCRVGLFEVFQAQGGLQAYFRIRIVQRTLNRRQNLDGVLANLYQICAHRAVAPRRWHR